MEYRSVCLKLCWYKGYGTPIYMLHMILKLWKMRKYEAGSLFIHLPLVLQQAISLQSRILIFLFQFCSAHDWGLEKYEVMLILPKTLTSCWSLHPMSRELAHQQFHGTEIILEEHFHFFSKPRWKGNIVRHTAKNLKGIFTITWWQLSHLLIYILGVILYCLYRSKQGSTGKNCPSNSNTRTPDKW